MPFNFQLTERLAGFSLNVAEKGGKVDVLYRELLGPFDPILTDRLEQLQGSLFQKIQGLPRPGVIEHLLVIINSDLSGVAYANELKMTATMVATRAIEKDSPVYTNDISDITAVDVGVLIPAASAVVLIRSFGWKRSLFYDFGPLHKNMGPRNFDLKRALAQQALMLIGLPITNQEIDVSSTKIAFMAEALRQFKELLINRCEEESQYQTLLQQHPWIFGGYYSSVDRHLKMDDENIPDFTAVRCYDSCRDIIELKQPFLSLFKANGDFSASFNDSWNQAERYLDFTNRQRTYLLDQKGLKFEIPRCILIIGYKLSEQELRNIKTKEAINRLITVYTYDQLLLIAEQLLSLVKTAGDRMFFGI